MSSKVLPLLVLAFGLAFCEARATWAQVVPDGTLPTTITTPNNQDFTIDGGGRSGGNLFHSFSQLSVPTGGSAFFNNALDVQNIFARVTGGTASNIDGMLKANGAANLFLLNPSGILFGPNASLNLGGSFVGTTASRIQFADGTEFSAVNSGPPLLTMSAPVGLQMGQNSAPITVQSTGHQVTVGFFAPADRSQNPPGLQVGAGQTLALIGNAVNFDGGLLTTAGGGHLEVGSVSDGTVKLNSTPQGLVGDYSAVQQFNDILFNHQSLLDASGSGGSIQLQGRNITFANGSGALLQNLGFQQPAQGITLQATGTLSLNGTTANGLLNSFIQIDNLGLTSPGDINVSAAQLLLKDGANIHNWTFAPAMGGNINVNVAGAIEVDGFVPFVPPAVSSITSITLGAGQAGNVTVSTNSLRILNSGSVSVLTTGSGAGGTLKITAQDLVEIAGNNPLTTLSSSIINSASGTGNAGSAVINTAQLVVRDSGILGSSAVAKGAAGNVIVNASELVEVSGQAPGSILPARIASTAEILDPITQAVLQLPAIPDGNAGSLTINTPLLRITEGAFVTVKADGPGSAGNVRINASSTVLTNQSRITAAAASGEGGNIFITGETLVLRHGSVISATAGGTGNGGNVTIDAPIILGLENSDIIANANQGRGGNINITTQGILGLKFRDRLTPENDITASSEFGVSGNVQVNTIGTDPNAGLTELPVNVTDASKKIATGCTPNQGSQFVATGRGGIPQNPNQQVAGDRTWNDLRDLSTYRGHSSKIAASPAAPSMLVQASGFERHTDGTIELIARPEPVNPPSIATCSGRNLKTAHAL
ncbi:filamentous hemagglutinin N-terminal domain-containing protein [Alkalinema pantanalense CENA528]|uniref:two-partner secretion domain-containing protein n=1 Tax=Alkalinema pantanalense TaxID=1620705 RepID=UPI003D6EC651